jgi:hypothetical protein
MNDAGTASGARRTVQQRRKDRSADHLMPLALGHTHANSLRDYFAGHAMAWFMALGKPVEDVADECYRHADAMLHRRELG